MKVFVVFGYDEEEREPVVIGVYSTRERAMKAFRESADMFDKFPHIWPFEVDE